MPLVRQDIKELREDLSPFLIHLTRNGGYKRWADIYELQQDDICKIDARSSLESILQTNNLEAKSPFGYFNFKIAYKGKNQDSKIKRAWLCSVCFTETPVDYIYIQCEKIQSRKFNFAPYGLAFFESSVREAKGNPVMYFESSNNFIRSALDMIPILPNCKDFASLMVLYEGFGEHWYSYDAPEIDFRWEREWRVRGDFNFDPKKDVAFGICPQEEIKTFEALVDGQFPFIDPRQPIGLVKRKLRKNARLVCRF